MRSQVVVPFFASVIVLSGCGHDEVAPAASLTPTPTPAATAKSLPPVDAKCTTDADCATLQLSLAGELQCCTGCGTSTAGTKAWVAKVNDVCAAPPHKSCPALACAGGLLQAECSAGTCTLKK